MVVFWSKLHQLDQGFLKLPNIFFFYSLNHFLRTFIFWLKSFFRQCLRKFVVCSMIVPSHIQADLYSHRFFLQFPWCSSALFLRFLFSNVEFFNVILRLLNQRTVIQLSWDFFTQVSLFLCILKQYGIIFLVRTK